MRLPINLVLILISLACSFVDLLHEFELGVWKAIFIHLIRVLYAAASHGSLVAELDLR